MEETRKEIRSNLQTVGQILKTDFRYRVPPHQRNFSWTSEEVQQLWDDINDAMEDDRPEYFLGTIVVQEDKKARLCTIIDGQQRLATLTMFFSAIRTIYAENGDDRENEIYMEYLGLRDRRTRNTESRLTLNELNEPLFQRLVVDNASDEEISSASEKKSHGQSNLLLSKAALFIRKAIRGKVESKREFADFLLELEDFINDRVVMIHVVVGDEADAYLIFETLNDRGLELSISDLLKNYLFGRAGKHLDIIRRQWDEMSTVLGEQHIAQFLRHYWLSKYGVVRVRELYKAMTRKFSSQNAVARIMGELRDASDKYSAIFNIDHAIWGGQNTALRKDLGTLQLFKLSQFRPLILASLDCLDVSEIPKIIRILVVISMRYSIIGSLGTGNLEKAYSDASINIRDGKTDTAAKIFSSLKKIYPDDRRFIDDFAVKAITKAKLARYILNSLANEQQASTALQIIEDESVTTLEHIMPKAQNQHWLDAASNVSEYNENVHRLGNLTLLEKSKNRATGNASFDEKKQTAFATSEIALTQDLCEYAAWTVNEIESRQRALAETAVKIWALSY